MNVVVNDPFLVFSIVKLIRSFEICIAQPRVTMEMTTLSTISPVKLSAQKSGRFDLKQSLLNCSFACMSVRKCLLINQN